MGGYLNKKESNIIGPNSKIGLDYYCPLCSKLIDKNTTYFEANKHRELCRQDKDKKHLEKLMKDLIKSKKDLDDMEIINNNKKLDKLEKNLNEIYKFEQKQSIPSNNNSIVNNFNNKKINNEKIKQIMSNSSYKPERNTFKKVIGQYSVKNSSEKNLMSNLNCYDMKDFPFEEKLKQFKYHIQNLKVDWRQSYCTLELDRDCLIKQSIDQFNKIDPYKELHINFRGEISHDAGGIIREWFTVIFKELQNENFKLFELSDTSDFSYKIHKNCQAIIENLDIFAFIGKVIGKALLDNLTINACFNKLIYKMLLDEIITLDDLVFIDKPLYQSLKELFKIERICDLDLYFVVQYENGGILLSDELVPDGSNVLVTNSNLNEYIIKRIEHIQLKDKIFINEIKSGLFSIIPEKLLKIFNSSELELILNGQPFIDVYDWKINSIYKGYSENSQVVQNFWLIISSLSQEDLGKFLQFCTGSSRVPIGGFSALESNRGNISKFCITKIEWNKSSKNYIRAHTCFNRLDMPEYPNYKLVQEAVNFIIQNEILGFGVD